APAVVGQPDVREERLVEQAVQLGAVGGRLLAEAGQFGGRHTRDVTGCMWLADRARMLCSGRPVFCLAWPGTRVWSNFTWSCRRRARRSGTGWRTRSSR